MKERGKVEKEKIQMESSPKQCTYPLVYETTAKWRKKKNLEWGKEKTQYFSTNESLLALTTDKLDIRTKIILVLTRFTLSISLSRSLNASLYCSIKQS